MHTQQNLSRRDFHLGLLGLGLLAGHLHEQGLPDVILVDGPDPLRRPDVEQAAVDLSAEKPLYAKWEPQPPTRRSSTPEGRKPKAKKNRQQKAARRKNRN